MKAFGPLFPVRDFSFEQMTEPMFTGFVSNYRTTLLAALWFAPPIGNPYVHINFQFVPLDPEALLPYLAFSLDASADYAYLPLQSGNNSVKMDLTGVDLTKFRVRLTSVANKRYSQLICGVYSGIVVPVMGEVLVASPLDVFVMNGALS
jgi:hypothetical protein